MIEIEEPPEIRACAGCVHPLLWMWSPRRRAWVSFVPGSDPLSLRVHQCSPAQDIPTWRVVREPDPPTPEYLAAKAALTGQTQDRNDNEETDQP